MRRVVAYFAALNSGLIHGLTFSQVITNWDNYNGTKIMLPWYTGIDPVLLGNRRPDAERRLLMLAKQVQFA